MTATAQESIPMYQWRIANAYQTLLQAEVTRSAGWIKSPTEHREPNLFSLHVHFARIGDITLKLTVSPVNIPPEQEEQLRKKRIYTLAYIREQYNMINGMMQAMEEYNPSLYQSTLNKQLFEQVHLFQDSMREVSVMDENELDELYLQRDMLEYASYAVEVIRLDYPRLKDVEFDRFQRELEEADKAFRTAVGGRTQPVRYSPETFWWRKKQK
jgi:hypothetical protein